MERVMEQKEPKQHHHLWDMVAGRYSLDMYGCHRCWLFINLCKYFVHLQKKKIILNTLYKYTNRSDYKYTTQFTNTKLYLSVY